MRANDRTRSADERRPGPIPETESPRGGSSRTRAPRVDRRTKARPHPLPIVVAVLVVVVAAAGIALMAPRGPAVRPRVAAAAWSAVATATPKPATSEPTPAYASFRGKQLLLPVPVASVTAVVFHQSSYSDTYAVKPLIDIRSASDAKAAVEAERAGGEPAWPRADLDADENGVWTGSALQLWRTTSNGKTDSALDCGAKPGTPVFSPVTGTVMRIRAYKLYGRIDDWEFHIKPDAWSDVDVIILHTTDPCVVAGDRVIAGVTQIAQVRRLSSKVSGLQLRTYTVEGGNHTHVQLTKIPKPELTWIVGKDPPGFKRRGN